MFKILSCFSNIDIGIRGGGERNFKIDFFEKENE